MSDHRTSILISCEFREGRHIMTLASKPSAVLLCCSLGCLLMTTQHRNAATGADLCNRRYAVMGLQAGGR